MKSGICFDNGHGLFLDAKDPVQQPCIEALLLFSRIDLENFGADCSLASFAEYNVW
jgi:hypothetical protein